MAPWEWKRVDSTGDDLRKNIVPYPDRQPSVVLFNLLNLLIEYANRMSATTEIMVGKTPGQNTPASTTRNATEQGMQVFTTIFKRIWRSMKEEFKKLFKLNAKFLPANFTFGEGKGARREDYLLSSDLIVPSADPNVASFEMQFFKAQSIRAASQQVPGYDIDYVERQFLKSMRVEAVDLYFPGSGKVPPPPNPKIAVAEMQLKIKQMQLEDSRAQWVLSLMEQRRLNTAQIIKLQADAAAAMAGIDEGRAATQLQYLQAALDALQAHNQIINERISALAEMQGTSGEAGGGNVNGNQTGGGALPAIPGMEGGPGDAGGMGAAEEMAGELEGAME